MSDLQTYKDKLHTLLQGLNAMGGAYLWGFHWGRPGDGFSKLNSFDFDDNLLRFHLGSDRDKQILSIYSPKGLDINKVPQGETLLNIQDARRVRWDWLSEPNQKSTFLEFWKMDGDVYGKSDGEWPTNTGRGTGDQSQPALSVTVFKAPSFLLTNVSGQT